MRAPTAPRPDRSDERHEAPATGVSDVDPAAADDGRLAYHPGLTGLRALAVTAVVMTASGAQWLPGGRLVGLEMLFVLSGYLTVTMLTGSAGAPRPTPRRGAIARGVAVVGRRARRILPGLLTALGGASILVLAARPDELAQLAPRIRATLLGIGNWQQIATASEASPSVLDHLWPLAVGAQVTVPVIVVLAVITAPRGRAAVRLVAVVLGLSAVVAFAAGAQGPEVSPRVMYGTDTRAGGLLLGVALGLTVRAATTGELRGPHRRRLRVLGLLALLGLMLIMLAGGGAAWIQGGGVLLVDLLAVLTVAAIVRGAPLDRTLDGAAVRWLGLRAYAIYLWHWPVLLALGGPDGVSGAGMTIVYLLAVAVVADATYRVVEVPLGATWHVPGAGRVARPAVAVAVAAIACGAACAAALITPPPSG
jgi:peptidoglycan/LPS O-acetylase OafA/YrhL